MPSSLPHDLRAPAAAVRGALARARTEGRPLWVVWRRPVPGAAAGETGKAPGRLAGERDAFRWRSPRGAPGLALRAAGAAEALEASGPGRIEALAHRAAALAGRIVVCDEVPAGGVRPTWIASFGFEDEPAPGGPWCEFPPARLLLPRWLQVVEDAGAPGAGAGDDDWRRARPGETRRSAWEHRAVRIDPGDAEAAALARLCAAAPGGSRHPTPAPGAVLSPWGGDPSLSGTGPSASGAGASLSGANPWGGIAPVWEDEPYRRRVARALADIRSGELEKVVVAREVRCTAAGPLDPDAVFEGLAARFPACRVFGVARGDAAFVGATPERLVQVEAGEVRADALAGSAPRSSEPAEDARLARALRESKKEQAEHAVVVRALREALAPLCRSLAVDEAPRVRRLANVQHLHSRARGRLHPDLGLPLLAIAARLHPTPAVAGWPRGAARAWLRCHEGLVRGWYAGAVGWCDLGGEGELAVALRSAWLRGREARVYAGAGVVDGSTPEGELRETRLKLSAVLAVLEGEGRGHERAEASPARAGAR